LFSCAPTLAQHASWKDGGILRNAEINIGLAVAIEDGLVVPVLRPSHLRRAT